MEVYEGIRIHCGVFKKTFMQATTVVNSLHQRARQVAVRYSIHFQFVSIDLR